MSKFIILFCFILQSCSLENFFQSKIGRRNPASLDSYAQLRKNMAQFKIYLKGEEEKIDCDHSKKDKEIDKLMTYLKANACGEEFFSFDRDYKNEVCKRQKIDGLIPKIVKSIIKEEKEKKQSASFQGLKDQDFNKAFNLALSYINLINNDLKSGNLTQEEMIALLSEYVGNVLLPMRELVIIKRSYLEKEENGNKELALLIPRIPNHLLNDLNTEGLGMLTQGPNPSADPYSMELVSIGNGFTALNFSATQIVRRDIQTLLKAPTSKNYVLALKWMTLQMMISQVYIYDTILGIKKPLAIPQSCQNHLNGDLPKNFTFKYEDGMSEKFMDGILNAHGLIFNDQESMYTDYYLDNVDKDPTKDGYSGIAPFEVYKGARVITNKEKVFHSVSPELDDVAHFKTILDSKIGEVQSEFKAKRFGKVVTFAGFEDFKKILGEFEYNEVAEIKLKNGSVQPIYPGKQNLSPYLLEIMKKDGLTDYTQLFTEKLKAQFRNRKIEIPFPSFYSSPIWRDWSLRQLSDFANNYKNQPENHPAQRAMFMTCQKLLTTKDKDVFELCVNKNRLSKLSEILSPFESGDTYVPTRQLEDNVKKIYPVLNSLWRTLVTQTEFLPEAKPFELNFLLDQMEAGNPWARLKLSYMVALDQLTHEKEGVAPSYSWQGFAYVANRDAQCDRKGLDIRIDKISDAGKILGLHLPLNYAHFKKVLDEDEQEKIWRNIAEDMNSKNAQLFTVKQGGSDFYKRIEDISFKTILTDKEVHKSYPNLSEDSKNIVSQISNATEGKLSKFFLELYSLKNNREKQQQLFEEFSSVNGIDNNYSIKLNFLMLDEAYKTVIYKEILKQAAGVRRSQVLDQLENFCNMSVDDQRQFKNIFYSASKSQNELNQMAGLPTIPEEVLDKVNSMTSDEWRDMWWGIGSGIAGMAAIIVGGVCTVGTGGLCSPIGATLAAAGATALGTASIGIQIKLTDNEVERKIESNMSEKQVQEMENLGFANLGSSEEVHRSWGWTAFEALSIFPLIGVATRSAVLGPKLAIVSGKALTGKMGSAAFKNAAKSAVAEEEVRMARFLLGLDDVAHNAGIDQKLITNAKNQIEKVRALYKTGQIDEIAMNEKIAQILDPIKRAKRAFKLTLGKEVGRVTVNESVSVIDAKTIDVVYDYFGGNSSEMLRLIQSYSGERLARANRKMAELAANDSISSKIPVYSGVRNWFVRLRNENLAKNTAKFVKLEKDLMALPQKNKEAFKQFINNNLDDLTEVFVDIPMRKREIPYVIQIQGMPHFNFLNGRKIPGLSKMSEGQIMKKVFQSRARLVYESYKSQARLALKLPRKVQSEKAVEVFKQFQMAIADTASRKSGAESKAIMKQYKAFEDQMLQKMHQQYLKNGEQMGFGKFREMMRNPKNLKEEALVDTLWASIPERELLGNKEVSDLAHMAVKELSSYQSVDSFERYLNALKVLIIQKNPAVLEIM